VAQQGNWAWANQGISNNKVSIYSTCTDNLDNSIHTGTFSGSLKFGNLVALSGSDDVFIVKTDKLGNFLWSRSFLGSGVGRGLGICTDNQNNIYIVGDFDGSSITVGISSLTNNGSRDSFIAKINPSGNVLWKKHIASYEADDLRGITTDGAGNVIVGGSFRAASMNVEGTTITNSSQGSPDPVIIKYNTSGVFQWAITGSGNVGNFDSVRGIAADFAGNIYAVGETNSNPLVFGTTTLNIGSGSSVGYVVKISPNGTPVWLDGFSANQSYCRGISTNKISGDIFVAGQFTGSNVFYNGVSATNMSGGSTDGFVSKIDKNGNCKWINTIYGNSDEICWATSAVKDGSVYVAGTSLSTNFNTGNNNLISAGFKDSFFAHYDSLGASIDARSWGGSSNDHCQAIASGNDMEAFVGTYHESNSLQFPPFVITRSGTTGSVMSKTGNLIPLPAAAFNPSQQVICAGTCIDFTDRSTNAPNAWQWTFTGSTTATSTTQNPTNICYPTPGTYPATLIARNPGGGSTPTTINIIVQNAGSPPVITATPRSSICPNDTVQLSLIGASPPYRWNTGATTASITITNPGTYTANAKNACGSPNTASITITPLTATKPTIIQNCYQLIAQPSDLTYQWYFNGTPITTNANEQTYNVIEYFGNYQVQTTTNDGCKTISDPINIQRLTTNDLINIYPNPSNGTFDLKLNPDRTQPRKIQLYIYNTLGEMVQYIEPNAPITTLNINAMAQQAKGLYIMKIIIDDCEIGVKKVLVTY
jgi:PKD repeat protein